MPLNGSGGQRKDGMAKRTSRAGSPSSIPPSFPRKRAAELLRRQLQKGDTFLRTRPLNPADHATWKSLTRDLLTRAFGSGSPNVDSVMAVGKYEVYPPNPPEDWLEHRRAQRLQGHLITVSHSAIRWRFTCHPAAYATAQSPPHPWMEERSRALKHQAGGGAVGSTSVTIPDLTVTQ